MAENPLRQLPKMDLLLAHPILEKAAHNLPRSALRSAARSNLNDLRARLKKEPDWAVPPLDELALRISQRAAAACQPHLRRVINATGVVLHTNLGRAPLSEAAAQAAYETARGYSNLEYDVGQSRRGDRYVHVEGLLCRLTGAQAAMVVNNNAAAVFLMLTALAERQGVAISRGELVEIGGSFRVPDIMERSGTRLIEVGTTNKTRLADYEQAITQQGAQVLLKVHPSNYEMVGFTEDTSLEDLSLLAQKYALPLFYDLGSGALSPAYLPALPAGPTVTSSLVAGCDLVCFSGDKLLGGPQTGIVVGKREYIETMKRHPLARILRVDKLSLGALEATLLLYADPADAMAKIPTLAMLNADPKILEEKAHSLAAKLEPMAQSRYQVQVLPVNGQVGGGSLPNLPLPSFAVALTPADGKAEGLEALLRMHTVPIVARVSHGRVLMDVRTLTGEDMDEIAEALCHG